MFGRVLTLPFALLFALPVLAPELAVAVGVPPVGWSLSASSTDPLDNIGPPSTDSLTVYLWLYCSEDSVGGVSRVKISASSTADVLGFQPSPGVTNSGSASELDLTLPGCPPGSFLAGAFLIEGKGVFTVCLGPGIYDTDDLSCTCNFPAEPFRNATMGYSAGLYTPPCAQFASFFESCAPTIPVSPVSWSRIKARYFSK